MVKRNGFSLMELLITLTILGILFSLGFSYYQAHLTHERRSEAKIALEKLALNLEQYHLMHNSYQDATLQTFNFSPMIADDRYQLAILMANETSFIIEAKPLQDQEKNDRACGSLLINALGEKTITGNQETSECWRV